MALSAMGSQMRELLSANYPKGWTEHAQARLIVLLPCAKEMFYGDGSTALATAAARGFADAVEALLPYSDPVASDSMLETPLMKASAIGSLECVKALLAKGDPTAVDHNGYSALHHACNANGNETVVELLLPVSNPLATTQFSKTPLMLANETGSAAMVRLLAPVSDVERQNREGFGALAQAAKLGDLKICEALRPYSNWEALDSWERPPAEVASAYGQADAAAMLVSWRESVAIAKAAQEGPLVSARPRL